MKQKIKRMLSFICYYTGITPLVFYLLFRKKDKILVLLYHRVCEPEHPFKAAVSPAHFEEQIEFLRKHFKVVSVREALGAMDQREIPNRPLAVITFDDGYRDNFETAYPLLKKYSLPAAFFLAAGSIGNQEPIWTSRVDLLFKNTSQEDLTLGTLSPPRRYQLGSLQERMKVCHEVKNEMKKVPEAGRQVILKELEEKAGSLLQEDPEKDSEMLSWEEVRHLAEDPLVEIGSHSLSHRMLANLPPDEVTRELEESKRMIEAQIGRGIDYLSYPGNSCNPGVQKLAERAGYRAAFAVDRSLSSFKEGRFALKRIHVEDGPLHFFQAEAALILSFLRSLIRLSKFNQGETT